MKGRKPANNDELNTEVIVPLKYLSNFWRSVDLPLNPSVIHIPGRFTTGATFKINSTKLYVAVVTSFINDDIKFLENIKQKSNSWNK